MFLFHIMTNWLHLLTQLLLELRIRGLNFGIKILINFGFEAVVISQDSHNICPWSPNGTHELAVHDLICWVWIIVCLFYLIAASPLCRNQIGYVIVFLYFVCFARRWNLAFHVRNGHVALMEPELWLFVLAGLPHLGVCAATGIDHDCRKAIAQDFSV